MKTELLHALQWQTRVIAFVGFLVLVLLVLHVIDLFRKDRVEYEVFLNDEREERPVVH